MQILKSEIDESVNFVNDLGNGQAIEARYVRRQSHYIAAYLSSQTGCNHGCKFCHLTTTKQTKFRDCALSEIGHQAMDIIDYYKTKEPAKIVNWNFMARGEPLANKKIVQNSENLFNNLNDLSRSVGLYSRFNLSTIIPKNLERPLADIFRYGSYPSIYYSIYSADDEFRNKWLPMAMPVNQALSQLAAYQALTGKIIIFHCAFIKDENDTAAQVTRMMEKIKEYDIVGSFNIVQYNPYSDAQGEETINYTTIMDIVGRYMPVKIISRVGRDVEASCGMFVNKL
jgi:adenine C2-methylase RlmN of 23S rRNA A2503 and tRNA A37